MNERFLASVLCIWLGIAFVGGLLNAEIISGQSDATGDAALINDASQPNIISGPIQNTNAVVAWVGTSISAVKAILNALAWNSPLFQGNFQIIRWTFLAILSVTMGFKLLTGLTGRG